MERPEVSAKDRRPQSTRAAHVQKRRREPKRASVFRESSSFQRATRDVGVNRGGSLPAQFHAPIARRPFLPATQCHGSRYLDIFSKGLLVRTGRNAKTEAAFFFKEQACRQGRTPRGAGESHEALLICPLLVILACFLHSQFSFPYSITLLPYLRECRVNPWSKNRFHIAVRPRLQPAKVSGKTFGFCVPCGTHLRGRFLSARRGS